MRNLPNSFPKAVLKTRGRSVIEEPAGGQGGEAAAVSPGSVAAQTRPLGTFGQALMRWWLFLAGAGVALACRYSVRDTGFVDLGLSSYRLEWVVPTAGPDSVPAAIQQSVIQKASGLLSEANILFQSIPAPAGEPAVLRLVDSEGRPWTVLRHARDADAVLQGVQKAVSSPGRESIYEQSLRAYAVVLLLEGTRAEANERARQDIQTAIEATRRLLPTLPKPVDVPPKLVAFTPEIQSQEQVLIWSLGLDPVPSELPRVALIYGRGRRLGTTLEGPMITQTVLRERLALIGQDCECDLDRAWLRGPLFPGSWDATLQTAAAKTLGFDPENPMIRAEVSRIVERGPQTGQRRQLAKTTQALGYTEESVEGSSDSEPKEMAPATESKTVPAAPPNPPQLPRVLWWVLGGCLTLALGTGVFLGIRKTKH